MGDPELVTRAQRAAVRLERSWDRWRRLHGLAAEQAQPVSSYVGYSLAEPWGRPRVVFGVGAEEAERLSALLEQDAGEDPRFSQGMLWEAAEQPHRPEAGEHGVNGTQPAEPVVPETRQGEPPPGSPPAGEPTGGWGAPETPSFPAQPSGMPSFHPAPPADGAGPDQGISADLAGWTASELPGQASAGLGLATARAETGAISQLWLSGPSGRAASMASRPWGVGLRGEPVPPESCNGTVTGRNSERQGRLTEAIVHYAYKYARFPQRVGENVSAASFGRSARIGLSSVRRLGPARPGPGPGPDTRQT